VWTTSFPLIPKHLWMACSMFELDLTPEVAWALATGGPWPDPATLSGDEHLMALALQEALKGVGLSSPNPPVGCILVNEGRIIGRGVHTRAGDPHGEVMALRDAEAQGENPTGATAFVTLEPCCHQGRTGPCTQALIQAGIRRVVVGVRDPNPRVDGGGLAILRAQGLEVEEGVLGGACARFHAPFFKHIQTGLPWVALKLAIGSDGSLGPTGQSVQVTPPEVQGLAHALRRASEAIVVGRHTIEVDNPQLTDRWPTSTAPHRTFARIVMDEAGRLPASARVWGPVAGQPAFRAVTGDPTPLRGVEDLHLPPDPQGCSLRHLLHELAARKVGRVLIEGGGTLAEGFLKAGLVDEFHRFQGDAPACGSPLSLSTPSNWKLAASARWSSGRWEVWR
jgi:diaminohydroxyphosphoribosylaminopyrimidine deaminase / 5-amino-6-(5-phosphoribosylamino)uracil reductase